MDTQAIIDDLKAGIVDWKEIYARLDEEFRCDHPEAEIRRAVFRNGSVHLRPQCLRCGEALQCVPKAALDVEAIRNAPAFDDALHEAWKARRAALLSELWDRWMQVRPQRRREYEDYLRSPEWRRVRKLVLERDRYVCQGCGARRATQVHHLTYEHRGAEFLFELTSVCDSCHHRIHPDEEPGWTDDDLPPSEEFDDGF